LVLHRVRSGPLRQRQTAVVAPGGQLGRCIESLNQKCRTRR